MTLAQTNEETEIYSDSLISDVDAEIALEISLRKRLVDTLESRIAWAMALKEILQQQGGDATPETVRNVALESLRMIEAPSDILLSHDPPPPFPPKPIRLPPRRPLPLNNTTKSKPSFLFIRSSTLDLPIEGKKGDDEQEETMIYLLKCPSCSKTSFTSLQGLLNHARLVHNLEWGTHEECITACAVPDHSLDLTSGTEVGLGPTGILPGLRNIFQMAVCSRNTRDDRGTIDEKSRDHGTPSIKTPLPSLTNSLNQSLGLHEESPALALFLGKDPIRRQIKVTDEDADVDTESINHDLASSQRRRMPLAHRHSSHSFLLAHESNDVEGKSPVEHSQIEDSFSIGEDKMVSANSRFHLVTRIIITDRSLWIPPKERTPERQKYTHKWMISVDSPSYAYHITSILNSVEVASTDATVHILAPSAKTDPPFVILGLADKSFVAKIKLSFSGLHAQAGLSLSEQTLIFEHWVDLYPLKDIIKGQDQVIDIELDKDTVIRAPRRDYTPVESRSLWNQQFELTTVTTPPKTDPSDHPTEKYEERLAEILENFPMTIEDFKGRRNKLPKVPYMLAKSVQHFLSFVTGRRKAIEWGRARAIHGVYTQSLAESPHPGLPGLTAADVYSWLSKKGQFPRPNASPVESIPKHAVKASSEDTEPIWCRFCGLDIRLHGNNTEISKKFKEDSDDKAPPTEEITPNEKLQVPSVTECPVVDSVLQITSFPRLNLKRFVLPNQDVAGLLKVPFDGTTLLGAADPAMVQWIHNLTKQWKLNTFHAISSEQSHPSQSHAPVKMTLDGFGKNRSQVETHLVPHALLCLLTNRFIRALVTRGLEVSYRDKAKALSFIPPRRGKATRNQLIDLPRMLTATHVLSGVLTRGLGRETKRNPMDAHLLLSLARLGVAVDDCGLDDRQNISEIKAEDAT